jgi:hypothetical protein
VPTTLVLLPSFKLLTSHFGVAFDKKNDAELVNYFNKSSRSQFTVGLQATTMVEKMI